MYAFENEQRNSSGFGFTPEEIEKASIEICNTLKESYKDTRGRKMRVQRDLMKIHNVKTLSELARRVLIRVHTMATNIE